MTMHHRIRPNTFSFNDSGLFYKWLIIAIMLCIGSGCATPMSTFGERARFSPAYRGYVLAQHDGSDDPDRDDATLILRDPLTGEKLRCEAEVETWRTTFEDVAADQVTDNNAGIFAAITAGIATGPLAALQPVGAGAVVEGALLAGAIYDSMNSEDAGELLAHGVAHYKRHRYKHAVIFLERALAKDAAVGIWDRGFYFLGMAYSHLDRDDRARIALMQFVRRAGVRDVNAYREAESVLEDLGEELQECESAEPVKMYW